MNDGLYAKIDVRVSSVTSKAVLFMALDEQTRRPGEHVVNAICETAECAGQIALLTLAGKLPRTYQFEWDCLAAWRAQPASCDARYLPWRVTVHENPSTGFKIVATSRIDRTE